MHGTRCQHGCQPGCTLVGKKKRMYHVQDKKMSPSYNAYSILSDYVVSLGTLYHSNVVT